MGKSRKVVIQCAYCKEDVEKPAASIMFACKQGKPQFCSHACSNKARTVLKVVCCAHCKTEFIDPYNHGRYRKYCSSKCAGLGIADKRHLSFIERWKSGDFQSGTQVISAHIRRYLFDKYDSKCARCGWSKVNPTTNRIPLEVEHIDGNWRNNAESNLCLLCPSCHSLTPTYRALNSGKGRGKG